MKLSKPAWNNVIIFSVMSMILFINIINNDQNAETASNSPEHQLIAPNEVILTLTVEEYAFIERIGTGWKISPALLTEHQITQMISSWQRSTGTTMVAAPDTSNATAQIVVVALAGQESPVVFELFWANEHLVVHKVDSQQWLMFPSTVFQQLIPAQLFSQETSE